MGLLTDPAATKNLADKIEKFGRKIGFVGYLAGIVWLVLQSSSEFNSKIFIDENALLPGLASPTFSIGHEELARNTNAKIDKCKTSTCQLQIIKVNLQKIFART